VQFNKNFSIVDTYALVAKYRETIDKVVRWCQDGEFLAIFCVLYFQRAASSTFQTCILNSHYGHTMCRSMVDIQFPTAENRRGRKEEKEKERRNHWTKILGPMACPIL